MRAVIIVILIASAAFAQAPDSLWSRTFGGSSRDGCTSVQQTTDGGFILGGFTTSFGAGSYDFFLVKTDGSGDSLWSRTFGGSGDEWCYSGQQTTDGGFILGGYTTSFGAGSHDFYLVKTDGSGDSLWSRTFGGVSDDGCFSVQQTTDGGFILGGYTTSFGAGSGDMWLVKTNAQGDSLWSRRFGGSGNDGCTSVQQTADGGFILGGYTTSFGTEGSDLWLVKTNAQGDSLWSRTFGGSIDELCFSVQQTTDGGFILGGYTTSFGAGSGDMWLVKTNAQGDSLWSRTFGGSGNDGCTSVQQTADGGFILGGYKTSFGAGGGDLWLVKTDVSGDSLWTLTFGGSGNNEQCYSVQQTTDGGFILGGYTDSFGAGNGDFWLVKTGREPCPPTTLPFVDDFDLPALDSCWFLICEDTSHWSLTERPGWMRVYPQQVCYDIQCPNDMIRPAPVQNFVCQIHVQFTPTSDAAAGVEVQLDGRNRVDIRRQLQGGIRSHSWTDGVAQFSDLNVEWNDCYLRIEKRGMNFQCYASPDSIAWTLVGSWGRDSWASGQLYAGLSTYSDGMAAIPADFDCFRIDPLPGTTVCGDVSGVWDLTSSPYYVTCDVTVPAGQTLIIQPGVQVLFTGHYKFNVYGNLQAIGTQQDSIVFTRAFSTEESKGAGIKLFSATGDTCRFEYCAITQGSASTGGNWGDHGGALAAFGSCPIVITHCTLDDNYAYDDGGALLCNGTSYLLMRDCVVEHNRSGSGNAPNGIVELAVGNAFLDRCVLGDNFVNQLGGALTILSGNTTLTNCTLVNDTSAGPVSGVYYYNGWISIRNSIIWNNSGAQLAEGLTCIFSNVQGTYPGTGNINSDPLFVDETNGDYHLQSTSPCIDAGDPESPLDPDGTIADIGAFHFPQGPLLFVSPPEVNFGLQDIGADSVATLALYNPGGVATMISSITHEVSAFVVDTSGLNGQVNPNSTYEMHVMFHPTAVGSYYDELVIVAQRAGDDTLVIPMYGEAGIIPIAPESLVVKRGTGNNVNLHWNPVTETISGQPLSNPLYHVHAATTEAGPFVEIGNSDSTGFVHVGIIGGPVRYFYTVTASGH